MTTSAPSAPARSPPTSARPPGAGPAPPARPPPAPRAPAAPARPPPLGGGVRARQRAHVPAVRAQPLDEPAADEPGAAGDERAGHADAKLLDPQPVKQRVVGPPSPSHVDAQLEMHLGAQLTLELAPCRGTDRAHHPAAAADQDS